MKLKHIFSLLACILLTLAACSPDDYSLGNASYSPDDLVEGKAYTVTVDATTNTVYLKSLVTGAQPLWVTPNGRKQDAELTLELPFAGDYEITFGVETKAGQVYGEPYKFTLAQNNFNLLNDDKYFYLTDANFKGGERPDEATIVAGLSKKWVPLDKDYGIGQTVCPMTFCNPDDVLNDGTNKTDLAFEAWKPNWDPGYQSWLIAEGDPYMDSYMTFGMSAADGCTVTVYRNAASGATTLNGKYSLSLSDKDHPTISFSDAYVLHHEGYDAACSNWTSELKIVELTPYVLQIAVYRDSDPWWAVYSFVSEEVKNTNGACIPTEDKGYIETSAPTLPTFDDLATDLFTAESNGVTYVGSAMTYTINEETPYDWMWWNGSENVNKWQSVTGGDYTKNWTPAVGDNIADFELTITKNSKGTWDYEAGDVSGTVKLSNGKLVFDKEITILTTSNSYRTVAVKGTEFTVLSCEPGESLVIGVPASTDENGKVNSYLVATLDYKKIGGGQTGPTTVPLESDYSEHTWIENNAIRLAFWSYGSSGSGIFKDVGKVKLKKGQTIKVTFKLNSNVKWIGTPKCALIDNNIKTTWEQGCYDLSDAVTVNLSGETTVTLTNNTGSTQKFTDTCLDLSIQGIGYLDSSYGSTGDEISKSGLFDNLFESISCVIE